MILRNQLGKYAQMLNYDLGQTEKDYLQHLFLFFLSQHDTTNLVFKGGTALQKVYGLNRFSIDLDFTAKENNIDFKMLIEKIAKKITDFGYNCKVQEIKTIGKTFVIKIQGPLYQNSQVSTCTLRIEVSFRESLLLQPILKEIIPSYTDLQPYTILVMQTEEILAEKVRAIMTRNKPRDIFDLHFLLLKNTAFNIEFINKKLDYYKEKYNKKAFLQKIKEKEKIWNHEMKQYIRNLPSFESIEKEIIKRVS
ncbi:nucleotidyl transferase AbiEii/AbiGii toxin family protein [Candidatus Woesearchaeota archaeon]|nr:nucleotidyl transferase AbiEii/AbiGii toxin family protein [Candidatus Woesearchaeota archaeon]